MGMKTNSKDYQMKLINHVYNQIPAFTDIFTEETFYMTVVAIVIGTIGFVCILSRFVKIKAVEY